MKKTARVLAIQAAIHVGKAAKVETVSAMWKRERRAILTGYLILACRFRNWAIRDFAIVKANDRRLGG